MAATRRRTSAEVTVAERLFTEAFDFDFFQAVRILEKLRPESAPLLKTGSPHEEIVRLSSRIAMEFPASSIYEIEPPTEEMPIPKMIVAFMGLAGCSGVLPEHYTEMLLRIRLDVKHAEKFALRDWLDMFNHRLISLFYKAWEKYRFYIPYERSEFALSKPDAFTRACFSLIGMGMPSLRDRLRVETPQQRKLLQIEDLALLRYGGFLAHRPRCAVSLQALLRTYLDAPVEVQQFQGQWLQLAPDSQSSLGSGGINNGMGVSTVIGDRIWDVQSKIRVRLGPMPYKQFLEFLPDPSPVTERKALFLLSQLVRLYVGPEMDVEMQLVLQAEEVPMCRIGAGDGPIGARIGWNCWSRSQSMTRDADEPIFPANEQILLQVSG